MHIYHDKIGAVDLIDHMGDDLRIVNAARVSFGNEKEVLDDKDIKLIKYLKKNSHDSPFEHPVITFKFTVPLFVRSQHRTHRTWSYNEKSYRYTGENIQFYKPDKWRTQSKSNKQASEEPFYSPEWNLSLDKHLERSVDLYNGMIEDGIAREMARMVLPQNLYTEYYGTVNLRNALAFLILRDHPHAQWEIQQVAKAVKTIMIDLYPETMKLWEELKVE